MKHLRTIVTVFSLGIIAIAALSVGNEPIAYISVGALAGYLGKVNGTTEA